ncbi:cytidine/deoxycytidylate deaminase family protein [Flavobacterium suncheonense]|uniref:hypothetical protein n=1 Tax=Flavobacterium suncheonense TaxID=350894 RepID=UPI0003F756F9|nr:hypothetical protein [Flavobacterium suncheonense]
MGLNNFYKLREDFIILGLTGKMQAGADKFSDILSQDKLTSENIDFMSNFISSYHEISASETRKFRRIKDFFEYSDNWKKFEVIEYKKVVLLFILHECYSENSENYVNNICDWIVKLGSTKNMSPWFGNEIGIAKDSTDFVNGDFKELVTSNINKVVSIKFNINVDLKENFKSAVFQSDFFFNDSFNEFANVFFEQLDLFSIYLRHKLIHVSSYYLRRFGTLKIEKLDENSNNLSLDNIYTIAEIINQIIKVHRNKNHKKAHIIIDRLKNSYEMMYFREKYSGFYMIANNREDQQRKESIKSKIKSIDSKTDQEENIRLIFRLDETEYKVDDFKDGDFESFDIENCVQKSDYHIWYEKKYSDINTYTELLRKNVNGYSVLSSLPKTNEYYIYQPFLVQVLKLIALIQQPGLITPTYIERIMQIAFNTKLNSGCISRQVGAVVTDKSFSVKGIGWNEVPHGQVPCSSRDLRDIDKIGNDLTPFERGETDHRYKDGQSFNEKLKNDFHKHSATLNLQGRPCSFCFKSYHNAYEAKDNQVHTRSLHAEENAMLQISKYGGQPLKGGNLFTTASPCELCSKKAYQLGIENIFYIDLYPGISQKQVLEGGKTNPNVFQFQGAIGRSFYKFYEPFISQKDETFLRSQIKPTVSEKEKASQLQKLISTEFKANPQYDFSYLDNFKDDPNLMKEIAELIDLGIKAKQNN